MLRRYLSPMLLVTLGAAMTADLTFQTLETSAGPVEYTLLVPEGPGPHKGVLALPPGPQTREMVEAGLARWQQDWARDGFLVVSPVAPDSGLFTQEASRARIPELLDHVAAEHPIDGAWSLFGISNGGRSALVIGPAWPDRFRNITVIPGEVADPETLAPFKSKPVTLVVGSEDAGWLEASRALDAWLGKKSELVIIEGQGHSAFQTVEWKTLKGWLTR